MRERRCQSSYLIGSVVSVKFKVSSLTEGFTMTNEISNNGRMSLLEKHSNGRCFEDTGTDNYKFVHSDINLGSCMIFFLYTELLS